MARSGPPHTRYKMGGRLSEWIARKYPDGESPQFSWRVAPGKHSEESIHPWEPCPTISWLGGDFDFRVTDETVDLTVFSSRALGITTLSADATTSLHHL